MANIKSAAKRARQTEIRTLRNKSVKTRMRGATRKALEQIASAEPDAVQAVRTAMSVIDHAASKHVIHRNAAARKKSRLARRLNALQAAD